MSSDTSRSNRILALLLLGALLFANEWVLGTLFAGDGAVGGGKLFLIRAFDAVALLLALTLAFSRQPLGALYTHAVVTITSALLLFVAINVLAWALTPHRNANNVVGALEMLWQDPATMRRIYGTDDDAEITGRVYSPGAASHPMLRAMMRPSGGPWYTSGTQGSRVSCRDGARLEPDLNGAIWMFGGSTTYGTGVADCETIASALNTLDPGNTYVNFGVESRNQNPEIDHLLLLLRKGYRPKAVIFLDGLNDISIGALQIPNLHPQETPTITDQPYYYALINDDAAMVANLLNRLPVMQWLRARAPADRAIPDCGVDDGGVYAIGGEFHERPIQHLGAQVAFRDAVLRAPATRVHESLLRDCARRTQLMYTRNLAFLEHISRAFDFEFRVFFQPLTALMPGNPFIKEAAFDAGAIKVLMRHIQGVVRDDIAAGRLPGFVDISQLGRNCADCMVDANHYTAAFGREIAQAILTALPDR